MNTPRTNFVAHETGDTEWDRFPNRFGRMMAYKTKPKRHDLYQDYMTFVNQLGTILEKKK
jgi:hypothetical protein